VKAVRERQRWCIWMDGGSAVMALADIHRRNKHWGRRPKNSTLYSAKRLKTSLPCVLV